MRVVHDPGRLSEQVGLVQYYGEAASPLPEQRLTRSNARFSKPACAVLAVAKPVEFWLSVCSAATWDDGGVSHGGVGIDDGDSLHVRECSHLLFSRDGWFQTTATEMGRGGGFASLQVARFATHVLGPVR